MKDRYVIAAAYHEAAHAVIAAALGLPIQEKGIHIDTLGEGITYLFQRMPGNTANDPCDVDERDRTILGLKAGFVAATTVHATISPAYAMGDDALVQQLLHESYGSDEVKLSAEDARLTGKARTLVHSHWQVIESVAQALLQQPVTPKLSGNRPGSLWRSPDTEKQSLSGSQVAEIIQNFGLPVKVQP